MKKMLISRSEPLVQKKKMGLTIKICWKMLVFFKWTHDDVQLFFIYYYICIERWWDIFKINNCAHMYMYIYIINFFNIFLFHLMFLGWRYLLLLWEMRQIHYHKNRQFFTCKIYVFKLYIPPQKVPLKNEIYPYLVLLFLATWSLIPYIITWLCLKHIYISVKIWILVQVDLTHLLRVTQKENLQKPKIQKI